MTAVTFKEAARVNIGRILFLSISFLVLLEGVLHLFVSDFNFIFSRLAILLISYSFFSSRVCCTFGITLYCWLYAAEKLCFE